MNKQGLKKAFEWVCKANKIELDETEHRFHPPRRWRADYAWPDKKLLVELEGGVFIKSRHTSPIGFINDCDKYNQAELDGWTLLRYTVEHLDKRPKEVANQILEALNGKET